MGRRKTAPKKSLMQLKRSLKIASLIILGIVLASVRVGTKAGNTRYGDWWPTRDIQLGQVIVKANDQPRHTTHLGQGPDTLTAVITSEKTETAATVYLPIFQFGTAKGTAQISLFLNDRPEGTTEVSTETDYKMLGLLPSLSTRSSIRAEINRAIVKTAEQRIKEFQKVEAARQAVKPKSAD